MDNMEVYTVGGEYGLGIKTKITRKLQQQDFWVLEQLTKKENIFQVSHKVRSRYGRGVTPGLLFSPFNCPIVSELSIVLSPLPYQVLYAIYDSWHRGRLEEDNIWEHTT